MKQLRVLISVGVLAFSLSTSCFAGDVGTPGGDAPPVVIDDPWIEPELPPNAGVFTILSSVGQFLAYAIRF